MAVRVLVCGGRDYGNEPKGILDAEMRTPAYQRAGIERRALWRTLDTLHVDRGVSAIIHGGARGADHWGGFWARRMLIEEIAEPADWKTHGKRAGLIRNALMLERHSPGLVVACPGGRGTADMVARARDAGLEIVEVVP